MRVFPIPRLNHLDITWLGIKWDHYYCQVPVVIHPGFRIYLQNLGLCLCELLIGFARQTLANVI